MFDDQALTSKGRGWLRCAIDLTKHQRLVETCKLSGCGKSKGGQTRAFTVPNDWSLSVEMVEVDVEYWADVGCVADVLVVLVPSPGNSRVDLLEEQICLTRLCAF